MKLEVAECWRLTGRSYVPYMADLAGGVGLVREGGWIALTGGPISSLNMAYIDDGSRAEALLIEFTGTIAAIGHPAIILMPEALSVRAARKVQSLGLEQTDPFPVMTAHFEADSEARADSGGYTVVRVEHERELGAALELQAETFAMPLQALRQAVTPAILESPVFDLFLASRDGVPFSTVTTATVDDVTSLWAMATPPARQRQGAGRATVSGAMAFHRRRGVEHFFLGASPAGRPLYERCGFAPLGETAMWVYNPSGR